ncbi:MAG: nitroreductase [Xanthobacteraceae bacterium]|jgi:nitroreductase|nr:nitroreductase [Xanthobacteraceae bacterium]
MSDSETEAPVGGVAALALMEARRSVGATALTAPGPSTEELRRLLRLALRVPDHAGLEPWRVILLEGEARAEAGARLGAVYLEEGPQPDPEQRRKWAGIISRVFVHAPLVLLVVSRPDRTTKIPVFEQELSAGAVCMNLLHGAHALGYGATWVTGWATMNERALRVLGIEQGERIAGIVHIGTAREVPGERKRPDVEALVTRWGE